MVKVLRFLKKSGMEKPKKNVRFEDNVKVHVIEEWEERHGHWLADAIRFKMRVLELENLANSTILCGRYKTWNRQKDDTTW